MRSHNEGSVYPVLVGTRKVWRAAVSLPDGRRRVRQAATKAAARAALRDLLKERDAGIIGSNSSLGKYLEKWLVDVQASLAPQTWDQHRDHIRLHIIPALGHVKLAALTVSDVQRYLSEPRPWAPRPDRTGRRPDTARTLDARTLSHHRATLRRALADAERDGLVARNVAALAKPPATSSRPTAWLDAGQMARLFDATTADRMHPLWVLSGTTGMRQGELLALEWADVDLDAGHLAVRWSLQWVDGEPVQRPPKTRTSTRVVPLAPMAVTALRAHRVRQHQERLASGNGGPYEGLVFTTPHGIALHGTNVGKALTDALAAAGLPRITHHQMRHSAASVLLAAGVPLKVVSEILGHASIRVTADLYSHVGGTQLREAAAAMERAIR